jgi:hypothetical protein
VSQYVLCHATNDRSLQTGTTMRGHDDEIRGLVARSYNDLLGWTTVPHYATDVYVRELRRYHAQVPFGFNHHAGICRYSDK